MSDMPNSGTGQGQPEHSPQPGWFPQPGTTQLRYWDGWQWTDHYAPAPPSASSGEDSNASLPYVLGIFFGFIPALVLYLVKKDQPRVRFHSAQVLNIEIALFGLHLIGVALWIVGILVTVAAVESDVGSDAAPSAAIGAFVLVWLAMLGLTVVRIVLYIWLAVKTSGGEDRTVRYVPRLVKP